MERRKGCGMDQPGKDKSRLPKDMLGRFGLIPRRLAQDTFFEQLGVPELREETVPVVSALGRILSRQIVSSEDLPAFSRATMDGYAVRARDTFGATEALPAYLNLVGEIPMGVQASGSLRVQDTMKIATGGMLPEGADAVVMFEQTAPVDERMIEVFRSVAPGENVIQAGDDVQKGEVVLEAGHRVRPQDIGVLCGLGVPGVPVYRCPRVAVIPTGSEIVPPQEMPGPGQVRDINTYHLSALIEQMGGIAERYAIVPDDPAALTESVTRAVAACDVVVLSGGSSVGTRDLTADVLSRLGGPGIMVHGVVVKPGKPTICAVVRKTPVFGLPGHPAAIVIGFDLFVRPVLRLFSGLRDVPWSSLRRPVVRARMARSVSSAPGREDYLRVAVSIDGEQVVARPILGKSGLIRTLVDAHGTVVIPEEKIGLEKGEEVEVALFE